MLSFPVFVKFQPRRPPLFSSIGKVPTRSESLPTICFKFFTCNTYGRPRKRCKQKTYGLPKSFSCNIYKIQGVGTSRKRFFTLLHIQPTSHLPYTLPSSVSRNPFVCHSYENYRGCGVFFPFWNSPRRCRRFNPARENLVPASTHHVSRNTGRYSAESLLIELLERRIHQEGVIKIGGLAPTLARDRQEPRRKRLVPLHRQAGHVADDQRKLLGAGVARKGNGVQACAANRGIAQQRIHRNAPFAPALRQPRIFQHRQHQPGITRLLHLDVFNGSRDRCRRGERAAHSEGLLGQIFDGHANRSLFRWRGRQIDSHVRPAGFLIHASRVVLDIEGHGRERIDQPLPGHSQVSRVLERCGHHVGRLQRNRKLVPEAGVIRRREKRRQRRHQGDRGKAEIALAVLRRFLELFHHPSRRTDCGPAHAVFTRHHDGAIQFFGVAQDFREQVRLRGAVVRIEHRRADRHCEFLLLRQRVQLLEKRDRLLVGQSFGVFRKRLRRDADGLHLITARFKSGLRALQHLQRVSYLLLVLRAVQIDECGDRPNLRVGRICRGVLLRRGSLSLCVRGAQRRRQREKGERDERKKPECRAKLHGKSPLQP